MHTRQTDEQWAAQQVGPLPKMWQGRILARWSRRRAAAQDAGPHWTPAKEAASRAANLDLLTLTQQLKSVRTPLDATDAEICDKAEAMADHCAAMAERYHHAEALHAAMVRACKGQGIEPPKLKDDATGPADLLPAIRRMICPLWWRRQLRRQHAKAVEGGAITLGLVNRRAAPYVSDESVIRRAQQNRRNAATLENTTATNELGQTYTLAELAAKGPANKAIRRAELMTRIAGFERIARDCGHSGLFWTITCPSRMHRWRTTKGGGVVENPRYDGTNPSQAQKYLAKVWARIRAALRRRGVAVYGFRIAEPQHDGTPHWHLLTFQDTEHLDTLRAIVSHYAMQDSPNEPGAHRHRVDFRSIDWSRGTAAGYIAKYVAKNIDGYGIEKDLLGNDALTTAARVEAWAATWGIRQFQQVGGAPVGVWRELRRVKEMPEQAPDYLKAAHMAVNRVATAESEVFKAAAWDEYVKAQGGAFVGRLYRIRIATQEREGLGRYGEPLPDAPVGVEAVTREFYTPEHMAWMNPPGRASRLVHWFVESVRHVWTIATRTARDVEGLFKGPQAPWTCVNNCTENQNGTRSGNEKNSHGGAQSGGVAAGEGMGWGIEHHQDHGWPIHCADDRATGRDGGRNRRPERQSRGDLDQWGGWAMA